MRSVESLRRHHRCAAFFSRISSASPRTILASAWLITCLASGCTHSEFNLATGEQEDLIYTTEQEEQMGANVASQLEQHYERDEDPEQQARVDEILDRIVAVCDRKEFVYSIRILAEDEMNAVSLPGGYVYIFRGLMDKIKSDDALAAVIAHEVGHITARHGVKRLQAAYGMMALQLASVAANQPAVARGVGAAYQTVFLAYSRQDEFQADKLSVKYLKAAGYDPNGVVEVLELLQAEQRRRAPSQIAYARTHPYISERIGVAYREISGGLDFKSYIKLTGQEQDLY